MHVTQRRADLRFALPPNFAARLTGRRVARIDRRGKFILIQLDGDEVLLCHLGMSGRILVSDAGDSPLLPHDHVIFTTEEGRQLRFNDARRFGFMDLLPAGRVNESRYLAKLGPEPLGNGFSGPVLAAALAGRASPIKTALLDQRVVAGLGNIYASEALYYAALSPRRLAKTVQGRRAERLVLAIREVLDRAIAAGGSSLRDYRQTSGELGYFQHAWAVYDREGGRCPDCTCGPLSAGIRRIAQSGRSTFYCPQRQH